MFGRSAARADRILEDVLLFWIVYMRALRWWERRHINY